MKESEDTVMNWSDLIIDHVFDNQMKEVGDNSVLN